MWAWTFIRNSWSPQYVSEGILFSKLLEGFIYGPCIWTSWKKMASGSRGQVFTRISCQYCCFSKLHSWPYTFPTIQQDLLDDVICNIVMYVDDTTIYSKCNQTFDLQLLLELQDTTDWGKKWLFDFNTGNNQLVSDQSNNSGTIDMKMDGYVIEEKIGLVLKNWG